MSLQVLEGEGPRFTSSIPDNGFLKRRREPGWNRVDWRDNRQNEGGQRLKPLPCSSPHPMILASSPEMNRNFCVHSLLKVELQYETPPGAYSSLSLEPAPACRHLVQSHEVHNTGMKCNAGCRQSRSVPDGDGADLLTLCPLPACVTLAGQEALIEDLQALITAHPIKGGPGGSKKARIRAERAWRKGAEQAEEEVVHPTLNLRHLDCYHRSH